jgi:integrase
MIGGKLIGAKMTSHPHLENVASAISALWTCNVLQKMEAGLGWESANHYRNLLSKIFTVAKKWGYFSGANPVAGVELPEKIAVREKHILTLEQISRLMEVLPEPARTMVWLSLLTGLRIGEVLGLPWNNVDFTSGQIRVTQAYYRGTSAPRKPNAANDWFRFRPLSKQIY